MNECINFVNAKDAVIITITGELYARIKTAAESYNAAFVPEGGDVAELTPADIVRTRFEIPAGSEPETDETETDEPEHGIYDEELEEMARMEEERMAFECA